MKTYSEKLQSSNCEKYRFAKNYVINELNKDWATFIENLSDMDFFRNLFDCQTDYEIKRLIELNI